MTSPPAAELVRHLHESLWHRQRKPGRSCAAVTVVSDAASVSASVERRQHRHWRPFGDENAVFFAHLADVETRPLANIDEKLHHYKTAPLESISTFRACFACDTAAVIGAASAVVVGALIVSGRQGAHRRHVWRVGLSRPRSASLHPLSLLTTTLNYGVIEPTGDVDVRLVYDHRVLDGATVGTSAGGPGERAESRNPRGISECEYIQPLAD